MIEEPVKYIKKVEISSLWDRYDIEWNLHPDVNVLAGINGSGKSTILDCISNLLSKAEIPEFRLGLVEKVILTFDNQKHLFYEHLKIKDTIRNIEKKAKEGDSRSAKIIFDLKNKEQDSYEKIHSIEVDAHETSLEELEVTPDSLHKLINANIVSTFDLELKTSEAVQKLSDKQVRTELDWAVHLLQWEYMEYQLNLGRKIENIFSINLEHIKDDFEKTIYIQEELRKIQYSKNRFLEIVDELFSETKKKVNRNKNQLEFLLDDDKKINTYQLSSGEKQLLIILLTVLAQDNKPAILLMDEPEISLHMKWQRNLITYIRELNPNVQLIIATHSPDIIMDGWMDKVFNMCDIAKDSQ